MKQLDLFGGSKEIKEKTAKVKKSVQLNLFADSEFFAAPAQGSTMYKEYRPKMELVKEDHRTEDEKAEARTAEAKSLTRDMFETEAQPVKLSDASRTIAQQKEIDRTYFKPMGRNINLKIVRGKVVSK